MKKDVNPETINLGLEGTHIHLMPMFGDDTGGVLHMLPGGQDHPDWFGGAIKDVYSCFGTQKSGGRGGHYHYKLQEQFFSVGGTVLWVLSDFRKESPTFGRTIGVILGWNKPKETGGLPSYTVDETHHMARLTVPNGVYHALFPVAESFLVVALGSTGYDPEDYAYPNPKEVPDMEVILQRFKLDLPKARD